MGITIAFMPGKQEQRELLITTKQCKSKTLDYQVISNLRDYIAFLPHCFCAAIVEPCANLCMIENFMQVSALLKTCVLHDILCIHRDVCHTVSILYWDCVGSNSNIQCYPILCQEKGTPTSLYRILKKKGIEREYQAESLAM